MKKTTRGKRSRSSRSREWWRDVESDGRLRGNVGLQKERKTTNLHSAFFSSPPLVKTPPCPSSSHADLHPSAH